MFDTIENYPYLEYKNKELHLNGKTIDSVLSKKETPIFIFLEERFLNNATELEQNLKKSIPNLFISYAIKANYLGRILHSAKKIGLGIEVMSLFELKLAREAKIPNKDIIFNGPAKTTEELEYALGEGIENINVDSMNELILIEKLAKKRNMVQPITVRIHPKLDEKTERKMLIKKNSKLGIDYSRGVKLFEFAKKSENLNPVGVHTHIGTNLTSHNFYEELLEFMNKYISDLEKKHGISIENINLGGGLASKSTLDKSGFQIAKLGEQISSHISNIEDKTIIFEPGRYLIEDSFVAITKVLRTKKSWGRKWAFTDIGANSLIPMRYTHYKVIPQNFKGKGQYTNIGGPLCLPVDVLTDESVDFEIEEEDLLMVLNCGAYTISMSEQFGYPRPAVYALNQEKELELIKPADDIDKMVRESF
ncbi:MAG: hypothetical protein GOP50_04120 [Candidatus Heimdallarchaeota archaeon]|nr:hypothetical protein [Candidatus Heimdallarchaeota archaeon]